MRTKSLAAQARQAAKDEIRAIEREAGLPSVIDQPLILNMTVQKPPSIWHNKEFTYSARMVSLLVFVLCVIGAILFGLESAPTLPSAPAPPASVLIQKQLTIQQFNQAVIKGCDKDHGSYYTAADCIKANAQLP